MADTDLSKACDVTWNPRIGEHQQGSFKTFTARCANWWQIFNQLDSRLSTILRSDKGEVHDCQQQILNISLHSFRFVFLLLECSILAAILAGIVQELALWIDEANSNEILFVIKPTRKGIFHTYRTKSPPTFQDN